MTHNLKVPDFSPFTVGIIQDRATQSRRERRPRRAARARCRGTRRADHLPQGALQRSLLLQGAAASGSISPSRFPVRRPKACRPLAKELAGRPRRADLRAPGAGVYRNSAAVIDADGSLLGVYRKMHIPDDPLFYEKYYFTPGDGAARQEAAPPGFKVWKTRYATIGVLICWDQWYPEAARITSLLGAQVLFYPTAIGWHPAEKDEWGAAQVDAWRTTQRAHAIANGVYVAAPNRVGHEDEPGTKGITFFGHSFIADPFGRYLAEAGDDEEILIADCDPALIEDTRRNWPFLRDRRIDAYGPILNGTRLVTPPAGRSGCRPSGSRTARPGSAGRTTSPTGRKARSDSVGLRRDRPRHSPRTSRSRSLHPDVLTPRRRRSTRTPSARDRVRLHIVPTDRVWLRDSAPTGVHGAAGNVVLLSLGLQRLGEVRQLSPRREGRPGHRRHHGPAGSSNRAAPTTAAASCSKAAAST